MSLESFYRGKRVLVTGHTGFTGGWLVAWLKWMGARVCGYGLPPSSRPNFFDAVVLDRGISSVFADIRDRETLANIFTDFQPEIVFHAVSARDPQDPVESFGINVAGTVNLLEEARLTGSVRSLVLLTALPASNDWKPQSQPSWLFSTESLREASALAFADSLFRSSRTSLGIARFPALIGGGNWSESSLVGKLAPSLLSGDPITLSDGEFPCCHVLEAVAASLHYAEELFLSSGTHTLQDFCNSRHNISAVEFAKKFAELWGEADLQIEIQGSNPAPIAATADASTPESAEWSPLLSPDEAISWAVEWYKGFSADPASAVRTTESQIQRYSKLVSNHPAVPRGATV